MSGQESLEQVRLSGGHYEGVFVGSPDTSIEVVHGGKVVALGKLADLPGQAGAKRVSVDLPATVLSEGVQVISLRSTLTGDVLDRITLMAGEALEEDVRGELALLRDELELLKRAFRRHVGQQQT